MHACVCIHTHTHTHTHQAVTNKEGCHVEEEQHFILTGSSQLEVRGSLTNPLTDWEIEPRGREDVSGKKWDGVGWRGERREGGIKEVTRKKARRDGEQEERG